MQAAATEGSAWAAGQGGAGTALAWGGFGMPWQDALPREQLDQDRLPEGLQWECGQAKDVTSQAHEERLLLV